MCPSQRTPLSVHRPAPAGAVPEPRDPSPGLVYVATHSVMDLAQFPDQLPDEDAELQMLSSFCSWTNKVESSDKGLLSICSLDCSGGGGGRWRRAPSFIIRWWWLGSDGGAVVVGGQLLGICGM